MDDNTDQIEYWNGAAGEKWVRYVDQLDELLAPFIPAILDRASLQDGDDVLDIGCGGGALTIAAAEKVGTHGRVTGVDVSAPLLSVANSRTKNSGKNTAFIEADASTYRSPSSLDGAVSRYGVMFFSDPVAAFASLRKNLCQEAQFTFVCWQGLSENLWARAPLEAAMPFFTSPLAPPNPHVPGPFAFADRDRLNSILVNAGWTKTDIEPYAVDLTLPGKTAAESAAFMMELGPTARMLKEQDIEHEPFLGALEKALDAHSDQSGRVRLPANAWLVSTIA